MTPAEARFFGEYAVAAAAVGLVLLLVTVLVENWVECRRRRRECDAQWWNPENWLP